MGALIVIGGPLRAPCHCGMNDPSLPDNYQVDSHEFVGCPAPSDFLCESMPIATPIAGSFHRPAYDVEQQRTSRRWVTHPSIRSLPLVRVPGRRNGQVKGQWRCHDVHSLGHLRPVPGHSRPRRESQLGLTRLDLLVPQSEGSQSATLRLGKAVAYTTISTAAHACDPSPGGKAFDQPHPRRTTRPVGGALPKLGPRRANFLVRPGNQ